MKTCLDVYFWPGSFGAVANYFQGAARSGAGSRERPGFNTFHDGDSITGASVDCGCRCANHLISSLLMRKTTIKVSDI